MNKMWTTVKVKIMSSNAPLESYTYLWLLEKTGGHSKFMKEIKILIYILEMCVRIARCELCHFFQTKRQFTFEAFPWEMTTNKNVNNLSEFCC